MTMYDAVILQSPSPSSEPTPRAINASGQVVGNVSLAVGFAPILWSSTGSGTWLDAPSGGGLADGIDYAINNAGESVGIAVVGDDGDQAVLWSPTGTATLLGDVPGGTGVSNDVAINASGQSVGWSETASGQDAVLWSPKGKATVLQDMGGRGVSAALVAWFNQIEG
jgi:hypothetical protein